MLFIYPLIIFSVNFYLIFQRKQNIQNFFENCLILSRDFSSNVFLNTLKLFKIDLFLLPLLKRDHLVFVQILQFFLNFKNTLLISRFAIKDIFNNILPRLLKLSLFIIISPSINYFSELKSLKKVNLRNYIKLSTLFHPIRQRNKFSRLNSLTIPLLIYKTI